jgi:hypothetical protein
LPSVTLAPRGELVIHLSRSHRVASSFRHFARSHRMASSFVIFHARTAWRVRFHHFSFSSSIEGAFVRFH